MQFKFKDEEKFQIVSDSFAITASTTGYTLMWSPDGVNFTAYDEFAAGEPVAIVNCMEGLWFYLLGNQGEITLYQ